MKRAPIARGPSVALRLSPRKGNHFKFGMTSQKRSVHQILNECGDVYTPHSDWGEVPQKHVHLARKIVRVLARIFELYTKKIWHDFPPGKTYEKSDESSA